jgi:uncharacterized cupredoxin-like copper-binding protein
MQGEDSAMATRLFIFVQTMLGRRPVWAVVTTVLAVVAVVSLSGPPLTTSAQSSTPPADGTAAKMQVEIGAFDIYFNPNTATIPADTAVEIVVTNHGAVGHNFSITDHHNTGLKNLDVSFDIAPGETKSMTINAPEGDYYFFCAVPGHEQAGQFGYLTATKGASITTAEATVTPRAG